MSRGQDKWLRVFRTDAVTSQGGRCLYCHGPITMRTATADHKWPRAKRGSTQRHNIVAACRPCNQAKGDRSPIEFYKLIDRRIPKAASDEILMVWAARRIWKRTQRACERIEKVAR